VSELRPLAGIARPDEAARIGYGVDRSAELLHRYLYLESQANRVMVAHLSRAPEWELKQALSLHQWQDAEHSLWLRDRVRSMRYPTPNLDRVPDARLAAFADELIRAADSLELTVGLYAVLKPALAAAYRRYLAETNPVIDHPTVRWLRFALQEEEEQIDWGQAAVDALAEDADARARADAWADHLGASLAAAGGVAGDGSAPAGALPPARATGPLAIDRRPARDDRFGLVMHFRGTGPPPDADAHEMNAWTVYKLLTEMHAPEMLATYSYDQADRPWEFYRDVGRHLWDECRHSMMGQLAFERRGLDWTAVAHDTGFALFCATLLTPLERYAFLVTIEQGLMAPTGKSTQYGWAVEAGDAFSRQCNDFDWADEVLHVQIGRRWLRDQFPSTKELLALGGAVRERYRAWVQERMGEAAAPDWWEDWYARLRAADGRPPRQRAAGGVRQLDLGRIAGG
jgi:hypothetical protein